MPLFDFDSACNVFGEKLIETLNSQLILKRTFPAGTVKEKSFAHTGWGDMEVRFSATSGAGADMREVRVRTRQFQQFFEVRYVQKDEHKSLSRYYAMTEQQQAIDDMIDYLSEGMITEQWTKGAVLYRNYLYGVQHSHDAPVGQFPGIDDVIRAGWRTNELTPFIGYTSPLPELNRQIA